MWRIYLDEDLMAEAFAAALSSAGFDCLTTSEAGRRRRPDDDQLAFATAEGRAILTANVRNFPRIHREWLTAGKSHAGILVLTDQRTSPGDVQRAMVALRSALPDGIPSGLEYVLNWLPRAD